MKLRAKIQLYVCAAIAVMIAIIGIVVSNIIIKSTFSVVDDSVKTSSVLASNHIANQLKDYESVVTLLGQNEIFSSNASDKEKIAYLDNYVEAYGFTSGNILDKDGVSIEDGTDFSDRGYVQKALDGVTNISDITLSKYTGTYGVSIAAPTYDAKNEINGVVYFRLDINFILDIIESVKISDGSYAYLIDKDANVIVHPDTEKILNYNLLEQEASIVSLAEEMLKGESGNGEYKDAGEKMICGYSPIANTNGWTIVIAAPRADFMSVTYKATNVVNLIGFIAIAFAIIFSGFFAAKISNPINRVKDALVALSQGKLDTKIETVSGKDEIAVLQNTTAELLETLAMIIGQANRVLGSIAQYDLTADDMDSYPGAFDSLAHSVNSIKSTLHILIGEVQNAVMSVDVGSRELADATAALSQGTVSQANSIQTLADNLSVVVDRINRNSENETVINQKLSNLDNQIHAAGKQMDELFKAVDEIEIMSSNIQKIVGTIDSIAFQTNILSLNASVEAARAGEMGNGFAVVAGEVRSLAEKCSESSKKTAELIDQCITSIGHAKKCADASYESLGSIIDNSSEIATAFRDISEDTKEQAEKSNDIQHEVNTISDVVQTTTTTVEETAASTEALSEQAANLQSMIHNFKL